MTRKRFNPKKKGFSNAKKVKYNGITFDSKGEYERYLYLRSLEKDGKIKQIKVHFVFNLLFPMEKGNHYIPSICSDKRNKIHPVTYEADFVYERVSDGKIIVNDFKGRTMRIL